MFDASWIVTTAESAMMVVVSAVGIYVALVLFTRAAGLRSFSKMSSFDFAVTVAFGSLLASTLLVPDPPLLQAIVGLGTLYAIQYAASLLRLHSDRFFSIVDNDPILLMNGSEMIHKNMRRARVTEADVRSKLREANVTRMEQVRAVVLETTGDISVLHADPDAPPLELALLEGVRGADLLR